MKMLFCEKEALCGGRVTIPGLFPRNGYQTFLKPAVMLFLLSAVPGSSTEV